jgi:Ca2+-binding RTX toxin-like protein
MWSVVQGTVSGVTQSIVNTVLSLTQTAANYWGWYVDDSRANITIRVSFTDLSGSTLATGGTDFQFVNSSGGLDFFEPNTVRELRTGVDPNGSSPDIRITVDSSRLASNGFHLGAPVDGYISSPPGGQIDLFSVLLHEIGHGLGLLTFLDQGGNDRTTLDRFVTQSGGNFFFNGPNAVAVNGGPVPLDDEIAHVSQSFFYRLFRPQISSGVASIINPFEVAFVQDFGVPIRTPSAGADVLRGFDRNDTIDALGGNDFIDGLLGEDSLSGGAGSDTLIGGGGVDILTGGDDGDVLSGGGDADILSGENGADSLSGGASADRLTGGAGADTLDGGDGLDVLSYEESPGGVSVNLETGVNTAADAEGDVLTSIERIVGSAFDDTLTGGAGADDLDGSVGRDLLVGGAGDDTVLAGTGDTVLGGAGADHIGFLGSIENLLSYASSPAAIYIDLEAGISSFGDAEGDDISAAVNILGSAFNDTLIGHTKANFDGGSGDDLLVGVFGSDTLFGGMGADTIRGRPGNDTLDGGTAFDTLDYSDRTDGGVNVNVINGVALTGGFINGAGFYQGGVQEDVISNFENILGTVFADRLIAGSTSARIEGRGGADFLFTFSGNDTLFGGDGDDFISTSRSSDQLFGEAGADTLNGGTGLDTLNGGDGADTADYSDRTGGVGVNLFNGTGRTAGALNANGFYAGGFNEDTLVSIEAVLGSAFGDRLVAGQVASRLDGRGGNDNISGLGGADTLIGGAGADTLGGGSENDTFEFAIGFGADRIVDFDEGPGAADVIRLVGLGAALDSFEEIIALAVQVDADVVFDFGGGDAITILNATISGFAADDFAFA